MNAPDRNAALEAKIIGHWTTASGTETCDFTFEPNHQFTCRVQRPGEPISNVHGYWDVVENRLRIGTSPAESEALEIEATEPNAFSGAISNGGTRRFLRVT